MSDNTNTTPIKSYIRNTCDDKSGICRLCAKTLKTHLLNKIFSKAGEKNNIVHKIFIACGLKIEECNYISNSICRTCTYFIQKVVDFKEKCRQNQQLLQQNIAIKRCILSSPLRMEVTKRINIDNSSNSISINSSSKINNSISILPNINADTTNKEIQHKNNSLKIQPPNINADTTNKEIQHKNNSLKIQPPNINADTQTQNNQNQYILPNIQQNDNSNITQLTNEQLQTLIIALNSRSTELITNTIFDYYPSFKEAIETRLIKNIETKTSSLVNRKKPSLLYYKDYNDMKDFDPMLLWEEIETNFPFLIKMLFAVSGKPKASITQDIKTKFNFIYAILMQTRWHELSLLHRINTVLLVEGGCSKKLQQRFNNLGICLSHQMKGVLLNLIGGKFMDKAVKAIKTNGTLRGTGDNWDLRILVASRKDHHNKDLHLFATNFIENRVSFHHLPNLHPINNPQSLSRNVFSLNASEWKNYISSSAIIMGRIFVEFFPKFKFFQKIIPDHIPHKYINEMSQKSNIIPMPIIDANEASYSDCVKILRTYEEWIAEIYNKAGKLNQIPQTYNPPLPDGPALPGQSNAHTNFTPDDVMKDMKIMMGGDQLTRVRFAGAKDLLKGVHTPADRLEHCSPFKPEMWHTKASLLQYSYSLLYSPDSVNEIGTLKYFREKLNRKNATPNKVIDSYEGSEELFISLGKGYIITAAMNFFGMSKLNDRPSLNKFPKNLIHDSPENKKKYFYDILEKFVYKYIIQKNYHPDCNVAEDRLQNYGLCSIFLTTLILQLKDTAKEGDGDRNLINQKLLFSVFRSIGSYSKYAIEMFTSIAQIECLLTPRLSHEVRWGFFVNWRGGVGHNMEDDLAQEISNRLGKSIVQTMGANKTISSISKVCKAVNGIKEIYENFDEKFNITQTSIEHSTKKSFNDECEIINDLLTIDPFQFTPGRTQPSFPEIKRSPIRYLNIVEHHKWIDKHKNQLSPR